MSLAQDLREQAWWLVHRDRRRPKQASLRRALSTAYYALFHLLVDSATRQAMGSGGDVLPHRQVLPRGFEHAQMADVARAFGGGTLPHYVTAVLGPQAVPTELRLVAQTFARLQEQRHQADYNLSRHWIRYDVIVTLSDLDVAFAAWRRVQRDPLARLFLALLTTHESARRR